MELVLSQNTVDKENLLFIYLLLCVYSVTKQVFDKLYFILVACPFFPFSFPLNFFLLFSFSFSSNLVQTLMEELLRVFFFFFEAS